jgi:hypothetical protein
MLMPGATIGNQRACFVDLRNVLAQQISRSQAMTGAILAITQPFVRRINVRFRLPNGCGPDLPEAGPALPDGRLTETF